MDEKKRLIEQILRILAAATARELDLIYRFARGLVRK